jgi:non-ribosomal peptide synthetase component F
MAAYGAPDADAVVSALDLQLGYAGFSRQVNQLADLVYGHGNC